MNLKKFLRAYLGIEDLPKKIGALLPAEAQLSAVAQMADNLAVAARTADNYSNPFSCGGNYQDTVNIQHSLITHQMLLAPSYSGFIADLFKLYRRRPLWLKFLPHGDYNHFITHQKELAAIAARLDEKSNQILYFFLFLKVVIPLLFEGDPGRGYLPEVHRRGLELINEIVPNPWDMSSPETHHNVRQQYVLEEAPITEGMYVIDGGAFDGDTAVIFSELVGADGRVFSFEPGAEAFRALTERRLPNVTCVRKGLYRTDGALHFDEVSGAPSASRVSDSGAQSIEVTAIDSFVERERIPRIDFIKMDIEGSELDALTGARRTIERFRPILVICIYHNGGQDYIDVPHHLIANYGDYYEFRIKQNSIFWEEAVIVAIPKK